MKTKTPKPRLMWANIYEKGTAAFPTKEAAIEDDKKDAWPVALSVAVPVAVIPLDDIEALVERAAKAMCNRKEPHLEMWTHIHEKQREIFREAVGVALTAAGIPCKQRRRPGPRGGKLYLSTSQAITALKKEVLGNTEHLAIKEATP